MMFWRRSSSPIDTHNQLISKAERSAASGNTRKALSLLRQMSLETFGDLLLEPPANAASLGRMLPSMASNEVQCLWTGASGSILMAGSLDFMHSVDQACREYLGHGIKGKILDYGCGWGRLLRLLLWYVDPGEIYGADPWDESIAICRQHNCPGHLSVCDFVPTSLPFTETFDLIYVFSVFTHLSEKTADAVLRVLRRSISDKGMLVITIRPPAYWDAHSDWREGYTKAIMLERHETKGFAFMPHERPAVDGDITYGDTSMTLDFICKRWPEWKIMGTTCNASDPFQILVFMLPE